MPVPDNSIVLNPVFPLDTLAEFPLKSKDITVQLESTAGSHETTFTFQVGPLSTTKKFMYTVSGVPVPTAIPTPTPVPVPTATPVPAYNTIPSNVGFGSLNMFQSQLAPFTQQLTLNFTNIPGQLDVSTSNTAYQVSQHTLLPDISGVISTVLIITYTPNLNNETPRNDNGILIFSDGVNIVKSIPLSIALTATYLNWWGDKSDGILNTTSNVSFPSVMDGDVVVKQYSNVTINAGHIVTVANRCKGLVMYVNGDCTINGTLSMTAQGSAVSAATAGEPATYTSSAINNQAEIYANGAGYPGFTLVTCNGHGLVNGDYMEMSGVQDSYSSVDTQKLDGEYRLGISTGNINGNNVGVLGANQFIVPNAQYNAGNEIGIGAKGTTRKITIPSGLRLRRFTNPGINTNNTAQTVALSDCGNAFQTSENNQLSINNNGTIYIIPRIAGGRGSDTYGSSFGISGRKGTCFGGGYGSDGTNGAGAGGGLLILFVRGNLILGTGGHIEAQGQTIANNVAGIPSGGGGNIVIFHSASLSNAGVISTAGGDAALTTNASGIIPSQAGLLQTNPVLI